MDRQQLAEENLGLAYFMANRQYRRCGKYELEELESMALEGLWDAARTWEEEKGAFSTYACRCIQNAYSKHENYNHRQKRTGTTVSLDARRRLDVSEIENALLDRLSGYEPGPEQTVVDREWVRDAVSVLSERQRAIVLMRCGFAGPIMSIGQIAERFGTSRQAVQSGWMRALNTIRKRMEP